KSILHCPPNPHTEAHPLRTHKSPTSLLPHSPPRVFLKTAPAPAVAPAIASSLPPPAVHAAGSDMLRVGLIGCGRKGEGGGRGRGAAENCLQAGAGVQLYAMADLFPDHLEYSREFLKNRLVDKVNATDDRCLSRLHHVKHV